MKHLYSKSLLPGALAVCLTCTAVQAQNTFYAPGDLVLYFQKEGSSNTVYANLGSAAGFRGTAAGAADGTNRIDFLNINATLTSAFGAGWASDPQVYAGLAGVFNSNSTNSIVTNGDPSRTLYVSASRESVGTVGEAASTGYIVNTDTGMSAGANGMITQNNAFEVNYNAAVVLSTTPPSTITSQNPFLVAGQQGTAFNIFGAGVQQVGTVGSFGTFGDAGNVEFALDLYRITAKNAAGQVAGTPRNGSYEGTVTINNAGKVSFVAQGASSPYDTWIATFPSITVPADKLASADADKDGLTNLMEFVLNGNPSLSDPSIAPTLDASGSNFVFSFLRLDASEAGSTLSFQYGSDLSGWTSATIGATGSTVGSAVIAVVENGAGADTVTVTVPKSVAPSGSLFGRLMVTQP